MISYREFIESMQGKGYIFKDNNPIVIDESSPCIETFHVENNSIGKVLEFTCPNNTIIAACGKNHPGDWKGDYFIYIKYLNDKDEEPFQEFHKCIVLTSNRHTIADIIVTKILQKEINRNNPDVLQSLVLTDPILKFIGSENPCEYPMWAGNYKMFHKEFLNNSLNLYSGEKIIFYTVKPDISITKVKFEMKVDILEITQPDELIILDKDRIADMTRSDYKSAIKLMSSIQI